MSAISKEFLQTGRRYGVDEIAADRAFHILAITATVAASIVLILVAARSGSRGLWPIGLYCASILLMFLCSAAHNLRPASARRELWQRFDHSAIFVAIAGTYTPFTVDVLTGGWSLWLTAAIWSVALSGIAVKMLRQRLIARIDVLLYLAFGWTGFLVAAKQVLAALDPAPVMLVGVGGVLYTVGAGFYVRCEMRFHQVVWHGFVLAAAGCHYAAIVRLAAAAGGI